ncbi:uncharacterized protein LOC136082213 [Hydra vulgaris]|uniref:Uncharacterized protein LOC136082213 n=1 Tax=Hydra vulgaris TaxID=6087 RepID=A0ABM4C5E1_HYDVU
MEYQKVEGEGRNSFLYIAGNNCYIKNKNHNGYIYLKCKNYQLCFGTAKIREGSDLLETMRGHSCDSKTDDFMHLEAIEKMRLKAATTYRGARKTQYSANPNNVEEAVLAISEPNPFTNILKGIVRFEDQLAILFCSSALLQILSGSTIIFIDATFRVVPSIFKGGQLLNISIVHCDIVLPVLTGRKEGIYIVIFRKIKDFSSDFQPRISMADYEAAIGSVLKVVFPEIRLFVSRFHYGQAILRKIKAVGLQSEYINPAIRRWGRKFVAMCLLPGELIRAEVYLLKTEMSRFANIETREKMRKFVYYFEKYWMTTQTPAFFSVHGLQFRTNNVSEALHSKMSRCMAAHPSFWRFLDNIYHQIILNAELELNQSQIGHQSRRGQRRESSIF